MHIPTTMRSAAHVKILEKKAFNRNEKITSFIQTSDKIIMT